MNSRSSFILISALLASIGQPSAGITPVDKIAMYTFPANADVLEINQTQPCLPCCSPVCTVKATLPEPDLK